MRDRNPAGSSRAIQLPDELVKRYEADEIDIYDIAGIVKRATSTVYQALRRRHVDTSKFRRRKAERNKEIYRLVVAEKWGLRLVGREFDLTSERIRQIVQREAERLAGGGG